MSNFVFLNPQIFWVAVPLVALILLSLRLVRGLAPWRKRTAALLQSLVVLLMLASLAQPAFAHQHDDMSLVLVLDSSASLSQVSRVQAVSYAQGVLKSAKATDDITFIATGRQARQLAPEEVVSGDWLTVTNTISDTSADVQTTNLAAGLRLASSVLPDIGRRRVVVVSDGWQTQGQAADEASRLQSRGIDVQVVGLVALGTPEVIVRSLALPSYARVGDSVQVQVSIYSTGSTTATLELRVDGAAIGTQPITLQAGDNSVTVNQTAKSEGFHALEAIVTAGADTSKENNTASATLVVKSQPSVLVVEDRNGEADALAQALRGSGMTVAVGAPSSISSRIDSLDSYDTVVLNNVAATSLTLDQQRTIQQYVQREGKGLAVTGGETSYAKGDYSDSLLEDVLPVSSKPGPAPEQGATALFLVFDRSSSMDFMMGLSNEPTKFGMAKEAAKLSVDAMRDGDTFGMLSFDTENTWPIEPTQIHANTDRASMKKTIDNIELGGGTKIYEAVQEATDRIIATKADSKHIVLLTDGQDFHDPAWDTLIGKLLQNHVSLSAIGVGSDADKALLTDLARKAQGRYYFTERLDNIPQIVFRDMNLALKQATIEGQVQPHVEDTSPVLNGIQPDQIPLLSGYDITTAKPNSVTALTADLGQPLLSHWNYGLGRVLAFTSSSGPTWGSAWDSWSSYSQFWNNAVRWTMAAPVSRQLQPSVTLSTDAASGNTLAHVSVESLNSDLSFSDLANVSAAVRSPSGVVTIASLEQTAPGKYEVALPVSAQGAYEVRVSRAGDTHDQSTAETAGFSVPPGPEYANAGTNDHLLKELNTNKPYLTQPSEALDITALLGGAVDYEVLWYYPLAAALVLLLCSVAVRRVEFRRARRRVAA